MTNMDPDNFGDQSYDNPYSQPDPHDATAVWADDLPDQAADSWEQGPGSLLQEHTAQHNFGGTPFIPSDGRDARKMAYVGATVFLSMAVLAALVAAIGLRANNSVPPTPLLPALTTITPAPPTTPLTVVTTATTVEATPTTEAETTTTEKETTTSQAETTTTTATTSTTVSTLTSFYNTCADAVAAGVAPMAIGTPGYRIGLDSDGDGLACNEPTTTTTLTTTTQATVEIQPTEPTSSSSSTSETIDESTSSIETTSSTTTGLLLPTADTAR